MRQNKRTTNVLHNTITALGDLAIDILLSEAATIESLAHNAARALVRGEADLVVSIVSIVSPAPGPQRWRPNVVASSDSDIDPQSPLILDMCSQAELPHNDDSCVSCRADWFSDFAWINSDAARRRASVGLHDYARASARLDHHPEPRRLIIELAGRTNAWRPSVATLERVGVAVSLAAAAYEHRIHRPAEARAQLDAKLTASQRRVARLLCEGLSEQEMAERLDRSVHTVHDHIKAIFHAWNVHSRAEAIWRRKHPFDDVTIANDR